LVSRNEAKLHSSGSLLPLAAVSFSEE